MSSSVPRPGSVPAPEPGAASPRSDAVARLLARPPAPEYLAHWAHALEGALVSGRERQELPAVLVRLGEERFLLPTAVVQDAHVPRPVHRLPGRGGDVLRGIVCLRGELFLCADLFALLGVERTGPVDGRGPAEGRARMLVLEREGQRWAVAVDEVLDVRHFDVSRAVPAQVTVARAAAHVSDGLVETRAGHAARLDPARLFAALARSLA